VIISMSPLEALTQQFYSQKGHNHLAIRKNSIHNCFRSHSGPLPKNPGGGTHCRGTSCSPVLLEIFPGDGSRELRDDCKNRQFWDKSKLRERGDMSEAMELLGLAKIICILLFTPQEVLFYALTSRGQSFSPLIT
jgi:hypothetical protein